VALQQLPTLTRRAAAIEDVDLNLFTGRFAIVGFRLSEPDGRQVFVAFRRLEGRLAWSGLLRRQVRLPELTLTGPAVRLVRVGPAEFNFSDLIPPPAEPRPPSRWTLALDRLTVTEGSVEALDQAVTPAARWRLEGLGVEGADLSTDPARPGGRLSVRARLNGSAVALHGRGLGPGPHPTAVGASVESFDLAQVLPYLPPGLPVRPEAGRLSAALEVAIQRGPAAVTAAHASGEARVEGLVAVHTERPEPFLRVSRIAVSVADADLLGRALTLGAVTVEEPEVKVTRDAQGRVDLLQALAAFRREREGPPLAARLDRLALDRGQVEFSDQHVSPARRYTVDLSARGGGLSTVATDPPGRFEARAAIGWGARRGRRMELAVEADRVRPGEIHGRVSASGVAARALRPYWPGGLGVAPTRGTAGANVEVDLAWGDGPKRARLSGGLTARNLALARPGAAEAFFTLPALEVTVGEADLLARTVTLAGVEARGLALGTVRSPGGRVAVAGSDAAQAGGAPRAPEAQPGPAPPAPTGAATPWRLRLERLALRDSVVTLTDQAVTPPRRLTLQGLSLQGRGLGTAAEDPPGTLEASARLAMDPGPSGAATLDVKAQAVRLAPVQMQARLSVGGLDVGLAIPYLPPDLPATPTAGSLDVTLDVDVALADGGLRRAVASGRLRLSRLALAQQGEKAPFVTIAGIEAALSGADALGRRITAGEVAVQGFDLKATRDPQGGIPLLALARWRPGNGTTDSASVPPAPPAAPTRNQPATAPPGPGATATPSPAGPGPWRLGLSRFSLEGQITFEDQAVSPVTTLALTDLAVQARDVSWPPAGPLTLRITGTLPGGGALEIEGGGVTDPLDVQVRIATRDAPIEPYAAYFPFPARFRGLFSGESLNEVKRENGRLLAASRGRAWARDLEVVDPATGAAVVRQERLEITSIDFAWPNYALVDRVILTRPEVRIERAPDGAINLRRLFTPRPPAAADGAAGGAGAAPRADGAGGPGPEGGGARGRPGDAAGGGQPAERRPGLLETMVLDFNEITLEEAYLRFLDRGASPAFSQDVSRLALTIRGLSNVLGRQHTRLTAQGIVGGDAALDLGGDLSGLGEALRADLVGELRDFALASANPYAGSLLSWIVRRGRLNARIHYRIDGDRIAGQHDVNVQGLQVEPARAEDETRRRLGIPLGLAVALLKDTRGNIELSVPLNGSLSDRRFDWGEAMWAAAKQVILKILAAPFRAIGRLFRGGGGEEVALAVDPVTFPPGSAVIGPAMETHLTRVADFLRRSPYVGLTLSPVVTARDLESLRVQEVTARAQRLQRERNLNAFADAVAAYFRQRAPGVNPPTALEAQLRWLAEREPLPEEAVRALADRRLAAAREALARVEGVEPQRLVPGPVRRLPDRAEDGRVEFAVRAE
jgi:hypothetical protein